MGLLASCATSDPSQVTLPHYRDWFETPESDDPLKAHRPAGGVWCTGIWVELDQYEMISSQCNYASRSTMAQTTLPAGATLQGTLIHEELSPTSGATSTAHAAVALGADIVWDKTLTLPAEGTSFDYEVTLERDVAVDELITIHLHNHGLNHYTWAPMFVSFP